MPSQTGPALSFSPTLEGRPDRVRPKRTTKRGSTRYLYRARFSAWHHVHTVCIRSHQPPLTDGKPWAWILWMRRRKGGGRAGHWALRGAVSMACCSAKEGMSPYHYASYPYNQSFEPFDKETDSPWSSRCFMSSSLHRLGFSRAVKTQSRQDVRPSATAAAVQH